MPCGFIPGSVKSNPRAEVSTKLGLDELWNRPLDPASMLEISAWTLEHKAPLEVKDLPQAFLKRVWLLSPDARSTCCKNANILNNAESSTGESPDDCAENQCAMNPLDLVTAVFMSADTFLQQEITARMAQCHFAVPLVLPNRDPEEASSFLLWPLRGVTSRWKSRFPDGHSQFQEGNLASTSMPVVSCVKLGRCGVSKSQVLNNVLRSTTGTFLHRGVGGGELPRRLSNGLVEIAWYLPTGDTATDVFPVPMVISNLRGDASTHEKCLSFLSKVSSAVVVFCGNLKEKEKHLLASCKNIASKLIVINLSEMEKNESRVVGFADQNIEEDIGLPREAVIQGGALSEEELANVLSNTLKDLIPDKMKLVTLEAAADQAEEMGLKLDEAAVCRKAVTTAELVLKGLDKGSGQFMEKQLPLQGPMWSKLAKIEKEERKLIREGKEADPQLQKEKKGILKELSSYKMTPAMKIFTNALFTTDKVERTYFLSWMKLKLHLIQSESQKSRRDQLTNSQTDERAGSSEQFEQLQNGTGSDRDETDSFCTDSTFEDQPTTELIEIGNDLNQMSESQSQLENIFEPTPDPTKEQQFYLISNEKEIQTEKTENKIYFDEQISDSVENNDLSFHGNQQEEQTIILSELNLTPVEQEVSPDDSFEYRVPSCPETPEQEPTLLSLEHFLREMGLIFELTHINPSSGSQNVLRLPSVASELLLYGVPLELMDGDVSNIPIQWLACVLSELKRCLAQEDCRIRVLTNLGVHHAKNAEILSALFGVKFPTRSTKGVYMLALCLPDNLRKDIECDFLLLIDVEGLCSDRTANALTHDNEIATVAVGLSDILVQNISPKADTEFETDLTVVMNALLRNKERGSVPLCQFLAQDEGLNSVLQASQLKRVSDMLQTETGHKENSQANIQSVKNTSGIAVVKGPWHNMFLSEPIDVQYSEAVLSLKQKLFEVLKQSAAKLKATNLPDFMSRLCAVWETVRAEAFTVGLQDTDTALGFSLLCTEISQWEDVFLEHMETWLIEETKKAFVTKAKAIDAAFQDGLLSGLKDKAREEVKTEVDKLRSKVDAYLMKDNLLQINKFKPVLMSNMDDLEKRITDETVQRLEKLNEGHCSSTQLKIFETILEKEQKSKLNALTDVNKPREVLLQDAQLEEEFEGLWSQILSNFDFRPSETDDITARVKHILRENLRSRGLHKHMKKLEIIGQNHTSSFYIYDEHFGYRSRLKHMFEDNNRPQKLEAQQLASNVIDEYQQFVADKSKSPADFSDSYITELLTNVERVLKEKSMEIRTAFEVDLKVYLCNAACQDFQKLHDRYAKDRELLESISSSKTAYLAKFIYQFRKRDQCQRMARAFTSMVLRPMVLDYVNRPLGKRIAEEIQGKAPQYRSQRAFHQSLLEDLIKNDCFEDLLGYFNSCSNYRLSKVQDMVVAYLSESNKLNEWRQQRLGEIVGMVAAAVSDTAEGTNGVLSDAQPLLERVCLTLEKDGDVDVDRAPLEGPLFSFTVEWDYLVRCLMELLAVMRLELAREFSQNVDTAQFLPSLPIQPHEALFKKVGGCGEQCPVCRAPCDLEENGHKVHTALLHRPTGMLPDSSQSGVSCPQSTTRDDPDQSEDMDGMSVACQGLHSMYPDWHIGPGDPDGQTPSVYWRYGSD